MEGNHLLRINKFAHCCEELKRKEKEKEGSK
jgi:hypothetical protein